MRGREIRRLHPKRCFAEYILADPNYIAHNPKGIDPKEVARLICTGVTTYKGVKETEARPGEWIAISGCGGLGHMAIFHFYGLIQAYGKALGQWFDYYNQDRSKFVKFIERYDETISDSRFAFSTTEKV